MKSLEVSHEELEEALSDVARDLDEEDAREEALLATDDLADDFVEESEDVDDVELSRPALHMLGTMPIAEWDSIKVSPLSTFGQGKWDFSCYPSANRTILVNFDYTSSATNVNLIGEQYIHWLRISKALTYYQIPNFGIAYGRAYSSIESKKTKILRLVKLFQQESLYTGVPGSIQYRTINDLSKETVAAFIESQATKGTQWEAAWMIQFWQKLSKIEGALPPEYAIHEDHVDKEDVSRYRKVYDNSATRFAPIPLDDYVAIVNHCVSVIDDCGTDIVWAYRTYFPTLVGFAPDRVKLRPDGVSAGSIEGVIAFQNHKPKEVNGSPWWPLCIRKRTVPTSDGDEYVEYSGLSKMIAMLIDACLVLILATTGMRRSELANLKSRCVEERTDGHWLTFTIFKTSVSSQGDVKNIPIPPNTARAIGVLEELMRESRIYGGHNFLVSSVNRAHFGLVAHGAYCERSVKRVGQRAGVDWVPLHVHRFRKTLAMYMIYLDPRNIDLIRHLFSHKSLKMTWRSILSLPGVFREIKKTMVEQNVSLLTEVLAAALNQKIGGIGGKRIQATINKSATFRAKLQDNGKETIAQYVDSILDQGLQILHRTNFAICLRTPTMTERAPCTGKNEAPEAKLTPNLFACDPIECAHAVFLENNLPDLESEIVFHHNISRHPYTGDHQRTFSEKRIKAAFERINEIDPNRGEIVLKRVANG